MKKEINIFIENTYEDFAQEKIDLAQMTKDAVSMTEYFLQKKDWVNQSCLEGYDFNLLYFDVVLTDDEKIHEINRDYREKDNATDVITFALFADSEEDERFVLDDEINLGEIIISLDRAFMQSKEGQHKNQTFKDELYFLLAHGILHLLGYDHQDEETLAQMWAFQQEMLESGIKK